MVHSQQEDKNFSSHKYNIKGEMDPLTLALAVLLPLLLYLTFIRKPKLNLPPSPPKLPVIGNLHQLGELPHRSLRTLSQKYGPLMFIHMGKTPTLVISSSEVLAEITKNHDVLFSDKPRGKTQDTFFYNCTNILFAPYGAYWRQARKICVTELLSQKRVRNLQSVREEVVAEVIERVRAQNGAAVNLSEIFLNVSNNAICRTALGRRFGEAKRFGDLIAKMLDYLITPCYEDLFPFGGWLDMVTGVNARNKGVAKELDTILEEVIHEHQISSSENEESPARKDLADIMLHLQKHGMLDVDLTRDNLKAILMDMFAGGTETALTILEWAFTELARNPNIMRKAQEEVREVAGKKQKIEEDDMHKLNYLKCIIKETMRLHAPVIPIRETSSNVKVRGYDIPAKTQVWINIWAIHRDPAVWDKPEEFLPERFINNPIDYKGQHSQFIPFGIGRRICPGMLFAMAEVEYAMANFLYWFDWDLPNDGAEESLDISEHFSVSVRKKKPLYLVPQLYSP